MFYSKVYFINFLMGFWWYWS